MTTRTDVNTDYTPSPRVIEVEAPSTELTVQDLVDTVRIQEEAFSGLSFTKLIDAAGKEDLGGGVLVGITANLQDAQVSFQARTTPAETGTVTTGSGPATNGLQTFVDTSADFVTAGVERGSLVINFTDQSIADVYDVVDANTLRTRTLVNGTDNDYDIGDSYQVFNIIQCNITGGNLVAEDENDVQISPVVPTAFTQIVRTASSSATLSESQDIQYASFNGGVSVDETSTYSGTVFPVGTPRQPVNNWTDALSIANTRGFTRFFVLSSTTLSLGSDFSGFTFEGSSKSKVTITLDPSPNLINAEFETVTITGTLDGGNVLRDCNVLSLDYVDGYLERCILNNNITLSGASGATFLDCFSGVPGLSTPSIDFGGAGSSLAMRNYDGGITLTNKTGSESASLDFNSGQVIIDNTVTTGTIVLRGKGRWQNRNSYTGGANIVDEMVRTDDIEQASFNNSVAIDVINGSSGTSYPIGTKHYPVDNLADAKTIATNRGFKRITIWGSVTIDNSQDFSDFTIEGENPTRTTVTFSNCGSNFIEVENSTVTGTITGTTPHIEHSVVNNLTIPSGEVIRSGLSGTLTLTGTTSEDLRVVDCYGAGNPIVATPSIDCGGDGPLITASRYAGGLTVKNKTGATNRVGLIFNGGQATIDSTVTAGILAIAGSATVVDNSTGSAVVNINTVSSDTGIVSELNSTLYDGVAYSDAIKKLLSMATGRIVESATGVFDFYEQDNTTIAFTLTKSGTQRTRS